jgi:hypothetical protein
MVTVEEQCKNGLKNYFRSQESDGADAVIMLVPGEHGQNT